MAHNGKNVSFSDNFRRLRQISDFMNDNMRQALEQTANEKDRALEKEFYRALMDQYIVLLNKLNEKIEEVTRLSITDPLTGVFNRGKLNEELKREVSRSLRYNSPLSLIMFDIDHFKSVNDTYGHDIGDIVLKEFTTRIYDDSRVTDIFGRWGGEEFLLILPETKLDGAIDQAERCRRSVEAEVFPTVGTVTCSIGVSYISPEDDVLSFTKRADLGLYQAKESGRNCVKAVTV